MSEESEFHFPTPGSGAFVAGAPSIEITTPVLGANPDAKPDGQVWPPSDFARHFCSILAEEKASLKGRNVLDVGAGSGILGIYAAILGAAKAHLIDPNPATKLVAEKNALTNNVSNRISFETSTFINRDQKYEFDTILCNHYSSASVPDNWKDSDDLLASSEDGTQVWSGADRTVLSQVLTQVIDSDRDCVVYTHICEEQNIKRVLSVLTGASLSYKCFYSLYWPIDSRLFGAQAHEWKSKGLTQLTGDGTAVREIVFLKIQKHSSALF